MSHKIEPPPPGEKRRSLDPCSARAAKRSEHTPALAHSQAAQAQVEIFVEHSQHAAVSVALTRDRGLIIITAFGKIDGTWRAVGQAASLPRILIDTAIDALQALRAKMERDR